MIVTGFIITTVSFAFGFWRGLVAERATTERVLCRLSPRERSAWDRALSDECELDR